MTGNDTKESFAKEKVVCIEFRFRFFAIFNDDKASQWLLLRGMKQACVSLPRQSAFGKRFAGGIECASREADQGSSRRSALQGACTRCVSYLLFVPCRNNAVAPD